MLAAKKLSRNKLIAYLAVLGVVAAAVIGYLFYSGSNNGAATADGVGDSLGFLNLDSIVKTKFDLKGLEKFDVKLFSDQRFKDLSEFYNETGIRSSVGRNNPFSPLKTASTTVE